MKYVISTIGEYLKGRSVEDFVVDQLGLQYVLCNSAAKNYIRRLFEELRDELTIVIETDYIDKVFRDEYYKYYSTKLRDIKRNCIRISFFEPAEFDDSTPWDDRMREKMIRGYRGFVVLRPIRKCIGRNLINPKALKTGGGELNICSVRVPSSCLGIKLMAEGFPHSSQDGEVASCAETTIWCLLDYFGNKYPDYRPALPTDILRSLSNSSYERQVPSDGLNFQQISLALREEGFGSKIYLNGGDESKEILCCYLESGIPVALAIKTSKFRHATVCIGFNYRARIDVRLVEETLPDPGKKVYIWNRSVKGLIINDDNMSPYRAADIDNPSSYYPYKDKDGNPTGWEKGTISCFIVPLHKKIYLLAEMAVAASKWWVNWLSNTNNHIVRTFLVSNRSYKEYLMTKAGLTQEQKEIMLSVDFPKFIWVTETSSKDDFNNYKVENLLLLDATSDHGGKDFTSWIFWKESEDGYVYDKTIRNFGKISLPLPRTIDSYRSNLTHY